MTATTTSSLYCDRDTRPEVDGMRTVCGLEFGPAAVSIDQLRHLAHEFGWTHTGARDLCPKHAANRAVAEAGSSA